MRIKAVRASNSDSGGRRRRRGGTKWGGESWEGGGEPLMMSLYLQARPLQEFDPGSKKNVLGSNFWKGQNN